MKESEKGIWGKEFGEFLECEELAPSASLNHAVSRMVIRDLFPSPYKVFFKLLFITALAGPLSLLVCPQMGLGHEHSPLMHLFMQFGPTACHAACAAFFSLVCLTSASFVLRPEELRVVRQNTPIFAAATAAVSLFVFLCATPLLVSTIIVVWFFGAVVGGITGIRVADYTRRALAS